MTKNPTDNREDTIIIDDIENVLNQIDSFHNYDRIWEFKNLSKKLLELVLELQKTDNEELRTRAIIASHAVSHTIGKEVSYIDYHEREMHKKNAAKIRTKEFHDSIVNAANQLYSDAFTLTVKD